jgi:bifunctional non-homologous end joining protein LigD
MKTEETKIRVPITNEEKIFWPEEGYTKGDLIKYYTEIAPIILPYLKDRPQSLKRYPNGINEEFFFHKDLEGAPNYLKTEIIKSDSQGKATNYLIAEDLNSLLYMVQLGCIDLNPWNARIETIDYPDYLIIDLDPEDISFEKVVETAKIIKKTLDQVPIKSFPKTSGGRGMHVLIPLGTRYKTSQVLQFAELLCRIIHKQIPAFTSLERSPAKRQKKVYLDYLQNKFGATNVSVYSIRPRPGAPVSTPLEWKEVRKNLHPQKFTIKTIPKRLKKKGDLFSGLLDQGINMEKALTKLSKVFLK